ncbi:MAG: DUF1150 family protein [Pseudomonadota bacterium]
MIVTLDTPDHDSLCYIRKVLARDVRDEIDEDFDGYISVEDDRVLYALHDAEGSRIALMSDRDLAVAAARQHELTPLSVH